MFTLDVVNYLIQQFPSVKFYNGFIDRNKNECIGVYARGSVEPVLALGGKANSSYDVLPVQILVRWSENANACQIQANRVFDKLNGLSNVIMNGRKVFSVQMLDACPIDIQRDEKNICEMTFRVNIIYERGV